MKIENEIKNSSHVVICGCSAKKKECKCKIVGIDNSLISFMFIYLKYIFLILISLISFSSLYYFGTIQGKNLKFISPGSIMTTILLFLSTYFFGLYIDNFSNYNELYGSIGALIIMMLYIWINSISLLLGFELNVVIYKLKNY